MSPKRKLYILMVASGLSSACMAAGTAPEVVEPNPPAPQTLVRSEKAKLKFKGGQRYARDLARGLALPEEQACLELGQYPCAEVHKIALGGVAPYEEGIMEPLENIAVAAPLAVERIALSACGMRVRQDLEAPERARIFKDMTLTEVGALRDPAAVSIEAAVDRLYRQLLQRRAQPGEVRTLVDFYDEVLEQGAERPGDAWATLSCFAVATSVEALFY